MKIVLPPTKRRGNGGAAYVEREREREREIDAHTHTHTHRIKGGAVSVSGCLRTYETHALKEAVGDLRP